MLNYSIIQFSAPISLLLQEEMPASAILDCDILPSCLFLIICMDFFKKMDIKPMTILKIVILGILAIIVLSMVSALSNGGGLSNLNTKSLGALTSSVAPGMAPSMDYAESEYYAEDSIAQLSTRNIAPIPPQPGTTGNDAEEFEVTEYSASIETRNKQQTCGIIANLKARDYVIFENANEYKRGCNYSFKVELDHVDEVLMTLKDLHPKDLNENTYTIKQRIEDFTSEIEILQKKKKSIDETLENALNAYDDITKLATDNRDAETLANIIDSKLRTIEKLTQASIEINAQLDRLDRSKAQQLDRLDYTLFSVNVYENKYIDGEAIKDSWKLAVRNFVDNVNVILQALSIGLVALLLFLLQYILYILILLVVAKYGWEFVKNFWKK